VSTFLFASIPVVAHSTNPLPFAARLVERGHRVLWYAGRRFHPQIAAVGAEPQPYRKAFDFSELELEEAFPELAGLSGVAGIRRAFADLFVGHAPQRVDDLQEILAREPVDAMLCDGLMYGVGLASELGGPAWATFGDGPLPYFEPDSPPFGPGLLPMRGPVGRLRNRLVATVARRFIFADAQRNYDRIRNDLGLPPDPRSVLEASTSPYLHLQGCTPGFDYPRRQLPPKIHWVGALRPDPPAGWTAPDWWPEVTNSDRPVVLVSQGSLRPDVSELLLPAVAGLAEQDVLVVVTTGAADPAELERAAGGSLPTNVRCIRFVPYDLILPHVSAFVTNGGYSGVTLALAHGVPLVQAGTTEEKAEIAARIHFTGVGVRLGTTRPAPAAVCAGVRRVLDDGSYASAAQRVKREMDEHDAGREGAALLEQLAETQQLVSRSATATAARH
jgi:UDP:flavonoid glycosyltransferase YjiC (YdhE family)